MLKMPRIFAKLTGIGKTYFRKTDIIREIIAENSASNVFPGMQQCRKSVARCEGRLVYKEVTTWCDVWPNHCIVDPYPHRVSIQLSPRPDVVVRRTVGPVE